MITDGHVKSSGPIYTERMRPPRPFARRSPSNSRMWWSTGTRWIRRSPSGPLRHYPQAPRNSSGPRWPRGDRIGPWIARKDFPPSVPPCRRQPRCSPPGKLVDPGKPSPHCHGFPVHAGFRGRLASRTSPSRIPRPENRAVRVVSDLPHPQSGGAKGHLTSDVMCSRIAGVSVDANNARAARIA